MDMKERDEEIWKMRREGARFSQIAARFNISLERARKIYQQKQDRIDNFDKWPPLKRILPVRIRNVLVKVFGSEEIFNHPEKLVSLSQEVFLTWKNFGRKSLNDLMNALESLGYTVNRDMKIADMRSQSYFQIGRTILRKYFDYYREKTLDDTEYIPVVRLIIEGITKEMRSSGIGKQACDEIAQKLKAFNREMYQNIWIEHAKEDHDPDEEPLDLGKEYESAKYTFDYIYRHGEHPRNLDF